MWPAGSRPDRWRCSTQSENQSEKLGEFLPVPGAIPEQKLIVHLPLVIDLHIRLPGESDTPMKLSGAIRTESGCIRGTGFCQQCTSERVLRFVIVSTGRVVNERSRLVRRNHHIHNGVLHGLKETDGPIF